MSIELGKLEEWFKTNGSCGIVVAFSGGLDSTLVAAVAYRVLGKRTIAVTISDEFITPKEGKCASKQADRIGIRHRLLELTLPKKLMDNPSDRCYRCKKLMIGKLKDFASENGYGIVIDGTNFDDLGTDRPGLRALKEERVRSPLAELGLGKTAIRQVSREMGLDYTKQPSPCLATRFEFGHLITKEKLQAVAEAEEFIRGLGYGQVRVRVLGDLAKIEVESSESGKLFENRTRGEVIERLKGLGFKHVAVDLEGYKTR
jgi:uncharacterized protein